MGGSARCAPLGLTKSAPVGDVGTAPSANHLQRSSLAGSTSSSFLSHHLVANVGVRYDNFVGNTQEEDLLAGRFNAALGEVWGQAFHPASQRQAMWRWRRSGGAVDFDLVDVYAVGLVYELRAADVRDLPLAVTDDGDRWTGLRLDKIVELSDGIMVARGDLGIECPFEELPVIQRRAVRACLAQGRPVIVATHYADAALVRNAARAKGILE